MWFSYFMAREFAVANSVKTKEAWVKIKKPKGFPCHPDRVYSEWISWGKFLGTNNHKGGWRPFEEARSYVRGLKFKGRYEWVAWAKSAHKPYDIPTLPSSVYTEWIGWGDWLGTGTIATFNKVYLPFEKAREYVHSLKLKNQDEWRNLNNLPDTIPKNPVIYKEWTNWGDWLGTGYIANRLRTYLSFEEAIKYLKEHGIVTWSLWKDFCDSNPKGIPKDPVTVYRKFWRGWSYWFSKPDRNLFSRKDYSYWDFVDMYNKCYDPVKRGSIIRRAKWFKEEFDACHFDRWTSQLQKAYIQVVVPELKASGILMTDEYIISETCI